MISSRYNYVKTGNQDTVNSIQASELLMMLIASNPPVRQEEGAQRKEGFRMRSMGFRGREREKKRREIEENFSNSENYDI